MAGHPSQMGCFEIRRAGITLPDVLLSIIWPDLDKWKGRFGPQPHQINDLAAAGVTNLLFYLREVILQDSVALRKMFPSHPVWSHPVFQHKAYEAFAWELELCLQEEEGSPNQLSILYQAMPLLADQLKALRAENKQTASEVTGLLDHLDKSQWAQSSQLQLLTSGGLTFRLEAPLTAAAVVAAAAAVWPQGGLLTPRVHL
jgi:Centromere DNA-binding protein complex CBF3 subunit, domain 2